jgi:hypothetical protein
MSDVLAWTRLAGERMENQMRLAKTAIFWATLVSFKKTMKTSKTIPNDTVHQGVIVFDFIQLAQYVNEIGLLDMDYKMSINHSHD